MSSEDNGSAHAGERSGLTVVDAPDRRRFEGYLDGELVGVVEYIPLPGKIIATHTEVEPAYEGQGVGSQLVAQVLDRLRAEERLVQPLCPYVTAWLRRHPEYADVVDTSTPH